ncbi:MAG TPA: hypothetical protein VLD37_01550 [Candidatus Bilamarchaeum sp.]|nr:hypothetical protein [Candidatus Bilamarchaeum sp.]
MNIMNYANKINSIGRLLLVTFLVMNLVSVAYASSLSNALKSLCTMAQQFLGIAVMVLIVMAGAIYAIGQILGAETRARAAVWATAMLTGAVIGIIIYVITPPLVTTLLGTSSSAGFTGTC